jgi:hypothetical protein
MKIGFGLIYLIFLAIGILYELAIHSFTEIAIINYVLTGFLYASLIFIAFFIVAKIAIYVVKRER